MVGVLEIVEGDMAEVGAHGTEQYIYFLVKKSSRNDRAAAAAR